MLQRTINYIQFDMTIPNVQVIDWHKLEKAIRRRIKDVRRLNHEEGFSRDAGDKPCTLVTLYIDADIDREHLMDLVKFLAKSFPGLGLEGEGYRRMESEYPEDNNSILIPMENYCWYNACSLLEFRYLPDDVYNHIQMAFSEDADRSVVSDTVYELMMNGIRVVEDSVQLDI